ncbi:hypothetical protein [Adhaeribacter radiodurans]|nr:hypothetical protein [Adhaeribacter radiodurans]
MHFQKSGNALPVFLLYGKLLYQVSSLHTGGLSRQMQMQRVT